MAIIKEYQFGDCRVIVHDDAIVKTQAEVDEILANIKEIASRPAPRTVLLPEKTEKSKKNKTKEPA